MNANDFVLKSIASHGVGHLFMFVGGLIDPFLPHVCNGTITPIVCANEAGVGYAADGYARASRKFGVALVIGGPGAFNAVGAIGAADADAVPLLLITGETATGQQGRGSFQDASPLGVEDLRLFDSLTGWSHIVPTPQALPQYLRDAFHCMLGDRRRPVHIAIPRDIQNADVGTPLWHSRASLEPPRILDVEAFDRFGNEALTKAVRVAILAGNGTASSEAADELRQVAETLNIPVATTFRAKGVLPEDHPLSLGMFGYAGHPPAEDCLTGEELEVLIVLGSSLNQRDTLSWNARLQPSLGIANINVNADELGRNFPVHYEIVGDVRTALRRLTKGPWIDNLRQTSEARRKWADSYLERDRHLDIDHLTSDATPIHPARIVHELRQAMPRDIALMIDSGAHRAFIGHYFVMHEPYRMFSATGLGPMGWAVAASIGVAIALPETKVVVVTGDGCMLQNGLEIQTAARHSLNILYVVFNNGALGNVWLRASKMGDGPGALCELPTHDWAAFANSLGVKGVRVEQPSELAPAFDDFARNGGPMLVDVRCDRQATTPVGPWADAVRHPDIYAE